MILEILSIIGSGTFFGAAIYISIAQHPATLEAGVSVGGRFFPPMYNRAAPMQIALAVIGSATGLILWWLESNSWWLVGALLLIAVIPITLILIKPVNDILLHPENDPDSEQTLVLLKKWGPKHWLRSIVSGASFFIYLWTALSHQI